jgi:16S rRNA (guanine527-N7)-methyltransferase
MPAPVPPPVGRQALLRVLERARALGFLGPGPAEEQLEHAEAFLPRIEELDVPAGSVAIDLGSGGGVPGLVLAAARPDLRWRLVDAMAKRTAVLDQAVAELGLEVEVVTSRAETHARAARGSAALVVARGFGPPAVLAECAAPLLETGGHLVVSEPPGGDPARWPSGPVAELGLLLQHVHLGPPAFAVLRQVHPAPLDVPRRDGMPAKRPRW